MEDGYDQSVGPREGKSAISAKTRQRIYGKKGKRVPFNQWYAGQQQGPAQGPVQQPGQGIDINTQKVAGLQGNVGPQPQAVDTSALYRQGSGQDFGGMDQREFLARFALANRLADTQQYQAETQRGWQVRPEEVFQAAARAQDPVRYEQEQRQAYLDRNPWGPGGQFEGHRAADIYTPEEILASQGNTAQNQILRNRQPISADRRAQLAGVPVNQRANAGEFDPEELLRQNAIYRANRTYM
jgi:hypothetical protein